MSDQKELAILAIQEAAEASRVDPKIFEKGDHRDRLALVNESEKFLIDAVQGRILENAQNDRYKNFDLATAKLVVLSVEYPEVFENLTGIICDRHPLKSYVGFISIYVFLRTLCDDHSYVLDREGSEPIIVIEDGYLLCPAELHSYLSHLV